MPQDLYALVYSLKKKEASVVSESNLVTGSEGTVLPGVGLVKVLSKNRNLTILKRSVCQLKQNVKITLVKEETVSTSSTADDPTDKELLIMSACESDVDDPFAASPSDKSYKPDESDSESHSDSDDGRLKKSDSARKVLFRKEQRKSEEDDLIIGPFSLQHNKATLKLFREFHSGIYECQMSLVQDVFFGYILEGDREDVDAGNHECEYSSGEDAVIFTRQASTAKFSFKANSCFTAGLLVGKEIEMHGMNIGHLRKSFSEVRSPEDRKRSKCIYCKKVLLSKTLTDHLKRLHSQEDDVKACLDLPIRSLERARSFRKLKNIGNRLFDGEVRPDERVPCRMPVTSKVSEHIECGKCRGLFAKTNYARHDRFCTGRKKNYRRVSVEACNRKQSCATSAETVSKFYETKVKLLLQPLRDDEITHTIRCDVALFSFAKFYAISSASNRTKARAVRRHLRLLTRILLYIQEIDESILDFRDALVTNKYDVLLLAIICYIGFDVESGKVMKPSTALLLRSCLSNLANALVHSYNSLDNKSDFKNDIKELTSFVNHHESQYKESINKPCRIFRQEVRMLKSECERMVLDEDLQIFFNYVRFIADQMAAILDEQGFDYKTWLLLGKAILVLLLTFNRRRVGEMSSALLQSYEQKAKVPEEIRQGLTLGEQKLADKFCVMRLVAKNVKEVTVLLSTHHVRLLDVFIKHRDAAGTGESKYLFGVPTAILYLDASVAVREFAQECGANNQKSLRGGLFRRHAATISQMLQLDANEIQQLADFLGHTVETHTKHYRRSCNFQEVCVLSRFFTAASEGDIVKYRGKSLTEINAGMDENFPLADDQELPTPQPDNEIPADLEELRVEDVVEFQRVEAIAQEKATNLSTPEKKNKQPSEANASSALLGTPTKSSRIPSQCHRTPTKQKKLQSGSLITSPLVPPISPKCRGRKKVPWTQEEKIVLDRELGPFILKSSYPPHSISFYKNLLKANQDVFLPRRTCQHIHSYIQYRITAKSKSKKSSRPMNF